MILLKITDKIFYSHYYLTKTQIINVLNKIKLITLIKRKKASFFLKFLLLTNLTKQKNINFNPNVFFKFILFTWFNKQTLINYILSINLSTTNTFINLSTIKGNTKLFKSAGMYNLKKKQKIKQPKAVITVLKKILSKSKLFKQKPAALHIKNFFHKHKSHVIKKLKYKIFLKSILTTYAQPHNGCRLKKIKRIKLRTKSKREEMTEWFKVADCKSVKFILP